MGLILGCREGAGERQTESVPGRCNTNPGPFWPRPEKNRLISESDLEARLRGQQTPGREACAASGYGPRAIWVGARMLTGEGVHGPAAPPAPHPGVSARREGGGMGRLCRELPVDWTHICLRRWDRCTPGATC